MVNFLFSYGVVLAVVLCVLRPTMGWTTRSTFPASHQWNRVSLKSSVVIEATTELASLTDVRRTHFKLHAPPKPSFSTTLLNPSPPSTAHQSMSQQHFKRHAHRAKEPTTNLSKRPRNDAYQWLTWFHNQFAEVGTADTAVLKKVHAAMDGYAQARNARAAGHAEALLSCYIDEVAATSTSSVASACENADSPSYPPKLNVTVFNAAMNAYAQIGDPTGTQRILGRLKQLQTTGHPYLNADVITYTTLANAWVKCRHPNAARNAEAVLAFVEQQCFFPPTTHLYNVVLSALANCDSQNNTDEVHRAEALLNRMEKLPTCTPDLYTYQTLISLYSKSDKPDAPAKAEGVLRWLEQKANDTGAALQPNVHCYTAVIRAYAYSRTCPSKAVKANQLLQELHRRHEVMGLSTCRPNVVAFTSVLNACTQPVHESERQPSYQLCKTVFNSLRNSPHYGQPNFLTYAAYLQTIASTLDAGFVRENETRRIFRQCCDSGQVGEIVFRKLRQAASPELWDELLQDIVAKSKSHDVAGVDYEMLPKAWKSNVRGERQRRNQTTGRRKTEETTGIRTIVTKVMKPTEENVQLPQ